MTRLPEMPTPYPSSLFSQSPPAADESGLSSMRGIGADVSAPVDPWFEASPIATMIVDDAGRIVTANPALRELVGATQMNLVGVDALQWYEPADRQRLLDLMGLHSLRLPGGADAASALVDVDRLRLVRADGKTVIHRHVARRCPAANGASHRIVTLIEQRAVEVNALTSRPASPEAALLASPVPMAILDRELSIVAINAAFSELTGYRADEVIGRWPFFLEASAATKAGRSGKGAVGDSSIRGERSDRPAGPALLRARLEALLDERGARDDVATSLTTRSGRSLAVQAIGARVDADAEDQAICLALIESTPRRRNGADAAVGRAATSSRLSAGQLQLQQLIGERGDMLVLLAPASRDDGASARLRVVECNQQVKALMGVERQAVLAASGALLTYLSAGDRQRFLTALRRVRSAVGRQDGPPARASDAHGPGELEVAVSHPQRGERLIRLRLINGLPGSGQTLLIGEDVSERRLRSQQAEAIVRPQRDLLVREVHHRIKNNLQGVAGLLRQVADRHPALAGQIDDIAGQIQAIAQVHGVQVQDDGPPRVDQMIEAVFSNLARNFGVPIVIDAPAPAGPAWLLPESEAVPIALIINELGTNAIKHNRPDGRVAVRWRVDEESVLVEVSNQGKLPTDFDFARQASGGTGLGLVKAMLPRRGADLDIEGDGDRIVARLHLRQPALTRVEAAGREETAS